MVSIAVGESSGAMDLVSRFAVNVATIAIDLAYPLN